jgi:hypothetical protein
MSQGHAYTAAGGSHTCTSIWRTSPYAESHCTYVVLVTNVPVADGSSGRGLTYQLAFFVYSASVLRSEWTSVQFVICESVCLARRRTLNRRIEEDDGDVELN